MHGTRDEHPEVFKARMQFHKDQKKQGAKDDQSTKKPDPKPDKRPIPLTRKTGC